MRQRLPDAMSAAGDVAALGAQAAPAATTGPAPAPEALGLRGALAIWLLYGAVSLIILAVYATHPAHVFYHYSGHGFRGAFGRMVVYLNFPFGFVALALLGIAIARLETFCAAVSPLARHVTEMVAIIAVPLLLAAAWPGVVSEAKLDVKPINAVPAIGVALAAIVTLIVWRATGAGEALPWHRVDGVRAGVMVVLAVLGLPWILAEFGVWIAHVPLLSRWIQPAGNMGGHRPIGVHLGDHHGLDGVLFVTSALVLSRILPSIGTVWLRRALTVWLGLMLVYGAGNVLNDFWGEQVFTPGWTRHQMPSVLQPAITPAWGIMVAIGIVVAVLMVAAVERQVARRAVAW